MFAPATSTMLVENLGVSYRQNPEIEIAALINAAWSIVIWQYTGLEDARFVTATTSGEADHFESTYQVCSAQLDSATTISDFIQQIQQATKELASDQLPLAPSRNEATTSPFLQSITTLTSNKAYLKSSCSHLHATGALIELVAIPLPFGNLEFVVHFAPSAIDQDRADHIAAAFAHVLNSINQADRSHDRLDAIDLVSDYDKAKLWTWNSVQLPETVESCVHFLFRQRAEEEPDMLAVDAWDGRFTYGELDAISDRIAGWLAQEEGIRPESIVPLCFEKSCWAIAALLGVIKAGGAIAFIDPANPISRRQEIMDQIEGKWVLSSKSQADTWEKEMGVRSIVVDEPFAASLPVVDRIPESGVSPNNLLYLIFTSGSTGKPKGCLIPHQAFISGALVHAAKSNLSRGSRVLQLASYSFDVSMLEILTSLISGACVCTPDMASMAQGLHPIFDRFAITWAFLTPSLVKLLRPEMVPQLKTLALGGEPLHQVDIETWAPHLQLINGYGPSECSVAAAGDPYLKPTSDPSNIGRAVGGLCWIVEAENHDRLVPLGAVGELLISGPILARGYLNDAEKTAASFIENPTWTEGWSLTPSSDATVSRERAPMRFYKTGDLARFNLDGTIQILGRKDTQVKLRGLRVELGEIEHNIARHPHVKHAAAFLPKAGRCKDKIVTVVCLRDFAHDSKPGRSDAPIDVLFEEERPEIKAQADVVRSHLRDCVPEYMVPAVWIVIEAWPLLVSVKLDRKRVFNWLLDMDEGLYNRLLGFLSADRSETGSPDEKGDADLSEVERTLRDIFARALNIPAPSLPLDKSFIALGGDSLAAMRVVSQCKRAGLNVKIPDMLKGKGIKDLADRVEKSAGLKPKPNALDASFPLSRAQQLCLGDGKETEGANHLTQSILLKLDDTVSAARVKAALGAIVTRHSMLRARFGEIDEAGTWSLRQTVASGIEGSYRFQDHRIQRPEDIATIAATADAGSLSGPVFSADLITGAEKQLLLLIAHSAVVDAVSWSIIIRQLQTCLSLPDGPLLGEESQEPVSFQDWVDVERESQAVVGAEIAVAPRTLTTSEVDLDYQALDIDQATATLLLSDQVHRPLRTHAVDFLVASLMVSFGPTFGDRETLPTLALWEDERGRASEEFGIDLSQTVGQFETPRPLNLNTADMSTNDEQVRMLKGVKDARQMRMEPNPRIQSTEISFRYRNLSNVIDGPDSLVQIEPRPIFLPAAGVAPLISNICIVAEVIGEKIQLALSFNKKVVDANQVRAWIATAQQTLASLVVKMINAPVEYTLSDFPLLRGISYNALDKLIKEQLPQIGLISGPESSLIEDIYPCSPMQQDLLLSQHRSKDGMYDGYQIAELRPRDPNDSVSSERLAQSWAEVVQRHASLRTIFIESTDGEARFNQVVLARTQPSISIVDCNSVANDFALVLANQDPISIRGPDPAHRLSICRIAGANHVVVKLEINHAIVDGVSAAVILRDLLLAYDGHAAEWEPALPFRNYIAHIRQTPLASSVDFWVEYLRDQSTTMVPRLASLETEHQGSGDERQLNVVSVPLKEEGVSNEALLDFCRKASVTPANVFQAAWALVLRVYAESPEEVCFGYLSAGRDAPLPGIQEGVGAFLTMLVSRLSFAAGESQATGSDNTATVTTLLDAVRFTAGDYVKALPHQHVGLSNIQHAVKTGGSPLFNTIIAVNRDVDSPADSTLIFKSIGGHEPDEYAIVVDVQLNGSNAARASLRHWTDHLTAKQANNIASALGSAVHAITTRPDTPISAVDLVGVAHKDQLLSFNTQPLPRANRLIFTNFEELARVQPQAPAVCAWDGEWTYGQLDEVSNRLAHYLRTLGVGPEAVVPHCFPKSGWTIVTCLAILKAGGAFVGLDPTHPRKRLEGLVQEAGAKVVCVAPQNRHLFEGCDKLSIVAITPEFVAELPWKSGPACGSIQPNHAACVVFTSGTTGRPKAVVVEHASMATLSDLMGPAVRIGPEARVFQFASYTFDTSNQDIFTTLQRGGCVCVPSDEDRVNDLPGALNRLRANHAHLTSTVISLMRPEQVPQLRWLFSAGEPLTRENVEMWAPVVELYNSYGPAESSVAVTCTPTRLNPNASPANIGQAFGCWAWIVDPSDHHRLMPLGAVGELLIEGPLLARHYLNNAAQTAAAFVENPRWAQSMTSDRHRRFYRTGDLCRFNRDGSLTIIGRRDSQIKIHGQRVELDHIKYEVQAQLAQRGESSLVSVDAVMLPKTQTQDRTLVAFVQFLDESPSSRSPDTLPTPMTETLARLFSGLQRALKTSLPQYMVPAMFVPITRIPRTANGKLARNVLREIIAVLSESDVARYMLQGDNTKKAPTTPLEQKLQAVWSKVLSMPVEKVGADDDFFQLGGDSVVAMRLAAAARVAGMSLTFADIFAHPVLSDLAQVVRTADEVGDVATDEPAFDLVPLSSTSTLQNVRGEVATQCGVQPEAIADLYPCTPLQEGLIALSMRQTGAYKDQRIMRLTDPNYEVPRCRRAVDAVVGAEPILRTRFVSISGAGLLQAVLDVPVDWVRRDNLAAYLEEDLSAPVTYGSSLVRLALVEEPNGERYIVWSGHHALCDGFSMDITFEQIAHAMTHEGSVMPKPVSFKGFIRFLQDQDRDSAAREFWQTQFPADGETPPQFPPRPQGHRVVPHRACRSRFQLNRPPGSKISVTTYLRAAWGLVVARHLDSSDVLFGVTLSGRNAPVAGISTMNGPTMTTAPFRMTVPWDSETTVAQYLDTVHQQAVAMMPFEHTGLQKIRRLNEQARAAIGNMGHRFAVEPSIGDSEALDGMEIVSADLPEGFYTDSLVIRNYDHSAGTIVVEARYDHTLISDRCMQRLLSQYAHVVQQLISQPETCVRDIQVLSPEDMGEIIKWNGDLPETVQECVHQLVAERTKERPDAEAVCAWDGSYTFGELDAVTERLAAYLQSLGVGPEVTVALCFDKSKWNVVSMLSVLKAGGCYTALSPAYPAARMHDILQDVQAPLVLCPPHHAATFTGMAPKVLAIDHAGFKYLPKPTTADRVTPAVQPSNAALIVFTSGSTGKPKGAIIEHRGLCSMQHYEGPHVQMGRDTRTLQFASHVFDVANSEVFTTLMRGGCVCVPSETERLSDLAGAVNKYRVNWSFHVPTTAETLDPEQMPGLKHLALGGEAISQGLCDRWASRVTLLNSYGPSECSIWTSVSHLHPGISSPNNIGRGLGCRTWITEANDHNRLAAIGCVGELCVEGPIVTRGYKANPEQTAAAYIVNPTFARALGIQTMRIYKTGDLVKYDSNGTILYVGRKDSQVKVRGQRIELGEVEQNIVAHGIDADAVVAEKIFLGGNKDRVALAAFLRLNTALESTDASADVENMDVVRDQLVALKRHLLETIPPHMLPSLFIPLRSMPVTQTGKKNRKALQTLGASLSSKERQQYALDDAADSSNINGGRACTSEAEKRLRALWAEVLGIFPEDSISANDNFFHRGGDSIQAMRLAAAARRAGKALGVGDLFRMPRLYQMAELWESSDSDVRSHDAIMAPFSLLQPETVSDAIQEAVRQCNVDASDVEDIYLCSPLQEGLMAVSTRKQSSYISTRIFDLPANLDIDRFQAAWQKAADVFPILRTRIILGRASESLQVVVKEKLTWQTITDETSLEQRSLPVIEYGGRLCSFAIDIKARKFVLALHHVLYDGWSATLLLGAVAKIYAGEQCPVGPGFNVFIRHLSQVDRAGSDDFWKDQLSGTPAHFPQLPSKTYEAKNSANVSHTIRLPAPEHQPTGVLKSTLLRAAWAIVSARHAGSNDITFGAAQSGRDCAVPGIEEVVGPVVTTVPVRIRINDEETIVSFLQRVQEQSVSMIAHQHAGVQTLRQLGRDVQAALDFTTLFEFGEDSTQSGFITERHMPELLDGFWSYPIIFECHLAENGETANVLARHDPAVIPTHQMDWICEQFEHVVQQLYRLTSDGLEGSKVRDLDIFGPSDSTKIEAWNARWPVGSIDGQTVHEAIAEQSRLHPQSLALSGWDGEMTYARLEHYATKLAKALVRKGVGLEVMVPLCFDKSTWAIVSSLAVIKAGGVVVHLGPTHPANRRKEILKTIGAEFVLVSPQHMGIFDDATVSTIPIDQECLDRLADVDQVELPQVQPSNAVYVCFTSGSTGRPKGIVVEHGNLRMSAQAHGAQFQVNPGTRVFQFSAYTFDIGLGDIFISLQRGATICTPSEWERLNELSGAITKYQANFMSVTPSVAKLLRPQDVPTLRTLVLGGEAPTQDNVQTWSDQLELVIIWGPAETTIYASATPPTTRGTSAQGLGNPMGSQMWLCDPDDHNRLVPLGCVGEIVVEGPLVSRGYLKDDAKTAAAYIKDPAWAKKLDKSASPRRMYKTGDLARYDANGYMLFSGRKDNQVKLHGQRMELDEVEHALLAHHTVRQAVARIPRHGPLKDKLVAMLSLRDFSSPSSPVANEIIVLDEAYHGIRIGQELGPVRRLLQENLPSYMVPTVWIGVEAVPLSGNSKIDRKSVDAWLHGMDQETYDSLLRDGGSDNKEEKVRRPSTPVEQILCNLISKILGLNPDTLNLNSSFLGLGGDSVAAMQLRSQSRAEGVTVSMLGIIRSQNLVELASTAAYAKPTLKKVQDGSFELSPIQQMYFDLVGSAADANMGHFDQSILLQVNSPVAPHTLRQALVQIVRRHSMLRARYSRNDAGQWYQSLAEDPAQSFDFSIEDVEDGYQVSRILKNMGAAFDIQKGPVFSAHVFNLRSEHKQLLFVRAHHLVVDVVSWHVLLGDLELVIATGGFAGPAPLSFPAWLRSQKEMAQSLEPGDVLPFANTSMPAANFEYWGMGDNKSNRYSDAVVTDFWLDEPMTTQLMSASKGASNAAPVDIILAALLHSFAAVFPDRAAPAVFSEGHGRESWSNQVDPSGTVGWFTTMSPLHVSDIQSDILTTVQSVKDLRRRLPANGMSYFSSRYLSDKGRRAFGTHFNMEIMFNYLGRSSEVGRENALLSPGELPDGATFDRLVQDENLPRWSLFDIVALVVGGRTHVTMAYNKHMQHQDRIVEWAVKTKSTLRLAVEVLSGVKSLPLNPTPKPSAVQDPPQQQCISLDDIEGIYPCVPVQQHMLAAREKHPDRRLYEMEFTYQARALHGAVDVDRIREAWQQVVQRHPALRTVFLPSMSSPGSYDQVVVRNWHPEVPMIECNSEEEMTARMDAYRSVNYGLSSRKPHHQLTLFSVIKDGVKKVAFKTETDHTLTDGVSVALILRDLMLAYEGKLPASPAPSFGSYAVWLRGMGQGETLAKDMEYWQEFARSAGASLIPHTDASSLVPWQPRIHQVKTIHLDSTTTRRLPAFCVQHGVTMAAVLQTAWGMVLQHLTGSDRTLFAFMTANRDATAAGAGQTVGPLINMLLCRIDLSTPGKGIGAVLRQARDDFLESLEHQYGLAQMEDVWQSPSWNSLMSLQYMDSRVGQKAATERTEVSVDLCSARDPTAWDVSIGLQIHRRGDGRTAVNAELGYWSHVLTDKRAGHVTALFETTVRKLVDGCWR
ncbi:peptide synthetase [Aspergillus sclerotiicarbonarius CBS 121057]|uniref:Peptide synthetase n=1 Tax=Aspergillus sclerotiicarbonarius (strain CBS 121057 / IBT 28362) TaxID=1448318 RepID=A0A319EDR8_ASPSB|nr:peptide synthetase [Aspergillus sclerotiicarbonarius CBS 121057]